MKKAITKLKIIITILFILLVLCNNTYANKESQIPQISEFTEEYKEWLKLPEEERKNKLAPRSIEIINNRLKKPTISTIKPYSLPTSYDLRKTLTMTVKDQGSSNVCWTFASMGVLESNLQLTRNITLDLSERHIDYATSQSFTTANPMGFSREVNTGANDSIAYTYFTNGMGAILETDMPFSFSFGKQSISYIQGKTIQTKVEDYIEFPDIKKINNSSEREEIINQIKEHIKTKGALYASINGDALQIGSEYFNTTNSASYYDGTDESNHAILIVGWDDNFSKTKFNSSHRPISDGAWIIRNSWGTSWGENGYAYVSYEDNVLGCHMSGIQKSSTNIDYNNIYQHDELGASGYVGYSIEKVYAANVFKKNTAQIEKLTEVSFNLYQDSYCKVYVNPKNSDKSKANLIEVTKQQVLCSAGYHTIKLDKPLALTGNEFVVVIEYYVPGGKANAAIEMKTEYYHGTATSNAGESYITANLSTNNNWEEISEGGKKYGNNSIKAFSNNAASLEVLTVGTVTQDPNVIYDETGGNISIPVTTNSIANGANLDIVIKKDNVDVTNKFTITGKSVNNDVATIGIRAPARTTKGTYQVEISYGSLVKKTTNFTITEYVHVTSVNLSQANMKIRKGNTDNLNVTVNPQNATNKTVNITSSNTSVATINQTGVITAVGRGTTKITAKSVDGNKIAECMVTVIDPQMTYGELVYLSEATAIQRGIVTIPVTGVDIDDETNINVKVKFDDREVTSNFTITGNKINNNKASIKLTVPADIEIGIYTIELSDPITNRNVSKTFEIKPIEISINNISQLPKIIYNENGGTITLDVKSIGIANGETIDIKIKKEDTDVTSNFTITGNTINNNQATVKLNTGAIEEGTYKVQAIYSTSNSQEESFDVAKYIHVDKIELNKENITMKKGESTTITLNLTPDNAINKKVNVSNSDPTVAAIDENLKIDALKRGETTITAVSEDGNKMAKCKVKVIDPTVEVDKIQYDSKLKGGKRGNVKIHANSIDVENDTELEIIIKNNEKDVTNKFAISGNKIIDNSADMLIKIPDNIELGTYQIQVKFEGKDIFDSNIQIEQVEVNIGDINLSQGRIYERVGGTITIPITSKNIANSENLEVKISKNNEDVTEKFEVTGNKLNEDSANVKIKAKQDVEIGEYKVEISYEGLVKQETTFTVEKYIQVESINLSKNQVNLKVGEKEKITITINPQNAINKNVIIESSNSNVATMNQDGTITAKAKGEATITIKSEDGDKTAICKVLVEEKNNGNSNDDTNNDGNNSDNNGGNNNNGSNNNNVNNNGGNNGSSNNKNQVRDTTTKDKNIPNTGSTASIIVIIISAIGTIVSFTLYRRYKYI